MKRAKKLIAAVLAAILVLGSATAAFASIGDEVREFMYGATIHFEHPPMEIDGHNFIPLNAITELQRASVSWDGDTQTATVTYLSASVIVEVGNAEMLLRNNITGQETTLTLTVPPTMIFGAIALPIEAVVEAFGIRMVWEDDTRIVIPAPRGPELHELVFGDFRIYLNDMEITPISEALQPFIYQGNLFLPAEAVLYALGDSANWDVNTGAFLFEVFEIDYTELIELTEEIDAQRYTIWQLTQIIDDLNAEIQIAQDIADRIAEAQTLAENNDFSGAMRILRVLAAHNPDNVDVAFEILNVETAHVQSIIAEARGYLADRQFDRAFSVIEAGLLIYSGNDALIDMFVEAQNEEIHLLLAQAAIYAINELFTEAINLLQASRHSTNVAVIDRINEYTGLMPRPLNVAAPFFDRGRTGSGGNLRNPYAQKQDSAIMSGVSYENVLAFHSARSNVNRSGVNGAYTLHNLDGQFRLFTGISGRVDGTSMIDVTLEIRGDGTLIQTLNISATSLPVPFEVSVEGVRQLRIDVNFARRSMNGGATYAVVAYLEK